MEKLKELGLDDKFGMYYDAEIVHKKEINSVRKEGFKAGEKTGAEKREKAIAKTMLSKKMDIPLISEITGLSKKQILSLR